MPNETQHTNASAPDPRPDAPSAPISPEATQAAPVPAKNPTPAEVPTTTQEDEDLEAQLAYENLKRQREARKRKRIIIVAIVGAIAVIGAIIFVIGQANKATEQTGQEALATGMAYQGDFVTTVSANGATEPVNTTVVSPEVDGIVEGLKVQEGDTVNEGDVLFTLKNETLDKEVHTAQTELNSAQRAADTANRTVSEAYDAYNKAVDEYNQAIQAGNAEAVAPDETSLRAAITSAEDAYQTAQDTLAAAQDKLDEARKNADKRVVRAPVSGTIVSLNAKNGTTYGATSGSSSAGSGSDGSLMQISNLGTMKVTVQVNEIDISKISKGQTAKATFSAIPGLELDATVEHIASVSSSAGSTDGGTGGVVNYAVDLIIPKPDKALKPGMTATVTITTQSAPNSLIVPSAAVQDGPEGKYVTVVDDAEKKQTHDVPVEVVIENSSEAAVKGNIKDGDTVLLGGTAGAAADAEGLTNGGSSATEAAV